MSNYPESLVTRCEHLEKVNSNLIDTVFQQEKYIESLRQDIRIMNELRQKDTDESRVWIFQNDGYDNIESMCSDLPVLISAIDLKILLNNGEVVNEL
jgi:hypothetical protein